MTWMEWYDSLWKPSWTPAPATIGLIWQIIYPIILVSFGLVFVQAFRRKVPWLVPNGCRGKATMIVKRHYRPMRCQCDSRLGYPPYCHRIPD